MDSLVATGPIPEKRTYWRGFFRSLRCLRGHRYRTWLAPPGTLTEEGEQAFRLGRCYTCGIEFAD